MANKLDQIRQRMVSMKEQEVDKSFIGMVYGPPGVGKTTLAAGLAQVLSEGGDILFVDSSYGFVSLDAFPSLKDNVSHIPVVDSSDLHVVTNALTNRKKGFDSYSVLIIDELSSIAEDVLLDYVREDNGIASDDLVKDIEGKQYGPMTQMITSDIRALRKIPDLHIIVVAHERYVMDHRKVKVTQPDFSPKLNTGLQKFMHVTGHVTSTVKMKGKDPVYKREIQSLPTELVSAKSRIPELGLKADFNDFTNIISEWADSELSEGVPAEVETPATSEEPDDLPTDGVPLADDGNDEPVYDSEE